VGLTLVEPLEPTDENPPGAMLTPPAPVVVQLSVLLAPETMVDGFAVKEVIVGAGESGLVQPTSPKQTNRIRPIAWMVIFEERNSPELS
jgi:hypothetical protein